MVTYYFLQVTNLWVSYFALENGCSGVRLSLPHVIGSDARPGVLPEHTLVISAGKWPEHRAAILARLLDSPVTANLAAMYEGSESFDQCFE